MDWQIVWEYFPDLMEGLWLTIQITLLAIIIGFGIAIVLTLMRYSSILPLKWLSDAIVFVFRGTPLLVQLYLVYYGSGQFRELLDDIGMWTYFRDAFFCAAFTLALNNGAYTAEILGGAIKSVNKDEIEAGKAYGMSKFKLYQRIIFPNAIRTAWKAYGNEMIFIMQATSLVSIITLLDLTGVAGKIISRTFAVYEVYIAVALLYLLITYTMVFLFSRIEKRLNKHVQT